MVSIDDLPEVM